MLWSHGPTTAPVSDTLNTSQADILNHYTTWSLLCSSFWVMTFLLIGDYNIPPTKEPHRQVPSFGTWSMPHLWSGERLALSFSRSSVASKGPSGSMSNLQRLQVPSPKAPCIQMIPALGPKVCKWDLRWAIWSPRATFFEASDSEHHTLTAC